MRILKADPPFGGGQGDASYASPETEDQSQHNEKRTVADVALGVQLVPPFAVSANGFKPIA